MGGEDESLEERIDGQVGWLIYVGGTEVGGVWWQTSAPSYSVRLVKEIKTSATSVQTLLFVSVLAQLFFL